MSAQTSEQGVAEKRAVTWRPVRVFLLRQDTTKQSVEQVVASTKGFSHMFI